jgi:hypothetical protein
MGSSTFPIGLVTPNLFQGPGRSSTGAGGAIGRRSGSDLDAETGSA